ncbi:chemotaxis protein CheW [Flavobacterium sp. W21_SRS_FM6]|uniref:chemotaxis protein CheW n=1 Tax=Flavobacterium sp. W21_SRS_FM6 TaxID=3240268 RepID=UPI003F8FC9D9
MSGKPFANEDVMEDYMSALLTEEPVIDSLQKQAISSLLEKAKPVPRSEPYVAPVETPVAEEAKVIVESVDIKTTNSEKKTKRVAALIPESAFQALFFEISGLTLAVPLTELGGIHQIETINPLFGKPSWFKGVMLHKEQKFNVVDTAKWIMPEKSAEKLAESAKYQYLILLDDSGWGLACERLISTSTLQPEDVKWRSADANRPWLAGMVKNKMCALVNVQQLVCMLTQGLSSNE